MYDASAPVLFELWYKAFYQLLWDDFFAARDSIDIYSPEAWRTNALVEYEPLSSEFDIVSTSAKETFQDIARTSFKEALLTYNTLDDSQKQWGPYQQTTIRHMAQIPAFSRELKEAPGHANALNATTKTHGPSWRMIVHLTDPVEAYVVYPGGQSGNPGSPYYDSMIETWEKGEYYRANYLKSPDEIEPVGTLQIKPMVE